MQFDSSKISIELSGSFLADIADAFVWMFKKTIIKSIQSTINSQIPTTVNTVINNKIIASNGFAPIMDGLVLDF